MNGQGYGRGGDEHADENNLGQKPRNLKYRTRLCRNYPLGTCRYGEYCSYLHIVPALSAAVQHPPPMHTIARSVLYPSIPLSPLSQYASTSAMDGMRPHSFSGYPRASQTETGTEQPAHTHAQNGRGRASRPGPHKRSFLLPPFASAGEEIGNRNFQAQPEAQTVDVETWRHSVSSMDSRSAHCEDATCPSCSPVPPATPVSATVAPVPTSSPAPVLGWHDFYATGAGGGYGWAEPWMINTGAETHESYSPSPHRQPPQTLRPVRHRNQFFKTKPCRFYTEPAGCIKGSRCNFIHESPNEGRRPSGLAAPAEVFSEGEGESGAESSVQSELSPITVSTQEGSPETDIAHRDGKKNFYPVTWRVVGGGVMMSGKREVCEGFMAGHCSEGADCRFAHPNMNEEYMVTHAEPPPMYSPISPILSPVLFSYPMVYPTLSPPQPFALPAMHGRAPASPPPIIPPSQTPKNGRKHTSNAVRQTLTISPVVQPSALPHLSYSPNRVVDGSTLVEHERHVPELVEGRRLSAGALFAARSVVRPVSTPPTPVQGHGYSASDMGPGIARLFAAEVP